MKQNVTVGMLVLALVAMLFGGTRADAQGAADDPAQVDAGKTVYEGNCAGCHGTEGEGSSRGRPLTGIADQGDRGTHFASVSDGKGGMPAFGERLSVEEIDSAISYLRLTFVAAPAAAEDTAEAPTELALTGAETPVLAVGGAALIAVGTGLVAFSRRRTSI